MEAPSTLPAKFVIDEPPSQDSSGLSVWYGGYMTGFIGFIGIAMLARAIFIDGWTRWPIAVPFIAIAIFFSIPVLTSMKKSRHRFQITLTQTHATLERVSSTQESEVEIHEHLKNFQGVQGRAYTRVSSKASFFLQNRPDYEHIVLIELRHREPDKSIPLQWTSTIVSEAMRYHATPALEIREGVEQWSRLLNVPSILGEGENQVVRPVDQLDATIKTSPPVEGTPSAFDLECNAPKTCEITRTKGVVVIRVKPERPWRIVGANLLLLALLALISLIPDIHTVYKVMFLVFGVWLIGLLAYRLLVPERIAISQEFVATYEANGLGFRQRKSMPTRSIETVRIGKSTENGSDEILIEGDHQTLRFLTNNKIGAYSPQLLAWLRDYITSLLRA